MTMNDYKKIMVVSPHPDDETLGAGGTLLKQKKLGMEIIWLNITDMKEEYGWDKESINRRCNQINAIRDFYSFDGFYNLFFPPTRLSSLDEITIINEIKRVFEEVEPDWLIIPGQYDAHSDHQVVFNCCMSVSKSFRAPYIKRITSMEILSETEYGFQDSKFEPNLFVDITEELEYKIDAINIYSTEIQNPPFPRSIDNIRALACYRGGSCSKKYAEAFHIVKQME